MLLLDEDFQASDTDGGSPSESDSEVSDRMSIASGDLAIAQDPKKKKSKKAKGDGDADAAPKKKSTKPKAKDKEKGEDGPAKKKQKKSD